MHAHDIHACVSNMAKIERARDERCSSVLLVGYDKERDEEVYLSWTLGNTRDKWFAELEPIDAHDRAFLIQHLKEHGVGVTALRKAHNAAVRALYRASSIEQNRLRREEAWEALQENSVVHYHIQALYLDVVDWEVDPRHA